MTLSEAREKCKMLVAKVPRDALIIAILILASSASFGLGYLAAPVPDAPMPTLTGALCQSAGGTAGKFVASKSGTKYYLPSCAGADKISEANKIWFASAAAAQAAGYAPAANCGGL